MYKIRQAVNTDIPALKKLFKDTILTINRNNYSQEEVEDWVSCGNNDARWNELVNTLYFVILVDEQAQILGYSSIMDNGYLHSMYIHKDFQGRGLASLLLEHIEQYAKQKKIALITSEVSITARPFFEKHGYKVDREQKRKAKELYLTNYWMSKGGYSD